MKICQQNMTRVRHRRRTTGRSVFAARAPPQAEDARTSSVCEQLSERTLGRVRSSPFTLPGANAPRGQASSLRMPLGVSFSAGHPLGRRTGCWHAPITD